VASSMGRNGKAGIGQMTFDRRVADAIELIEFLRRHLGVDKVIVLAESMGTLTGLPLTKHRPDLVQPNLPTPNLDRRLLLPLALSSPI
jgi:pimeloyl-ACP methyl ester carboxylesterase